MKRKIFNIKIILFIILYTLPVYCELLGNTTFYPPIENLSEPLTVSTETVPVKPTVKFNTEEWHKVRDAKETGTFGKGVEPSTTPTVGLPVQVDQIYRPGRGFGVDLPMETSLDIKGSKGIRTNFSYTNFFDKEADPKRTRSDITMEQDLVMYIQGKIGNKIFVNVDYNDKQGDKRDINVKYVGEQDELVQDAAFGDVTLSLPNKRLVGSYTKQVFGAKARAKYKNMNFEVIGSRSKGTPEVQVFTSFLRSEKTPSGGIPEYGYIQRRYYKLAFGKDTIVKGTERVFLDDNDATNDLVTNAQTYTVDDFAVPSSTYTGKFVILYPGTDYLIDYEKGILIFRRTLNQKDVVAVDYKTSNSIYTSLNEANGSGLYKIIKTNNDLPLKTDKRTEELGYRREMKNYYSLGKTKIVRDNGRGNFILKIVDAAGQPITQIKKSTYTALAPTYPEGIDVDFESGIFNFKDEEPFQESIYDPIANKLSLHTYSIFAEYQYRMKQFNLNEKSGLGGVIVLESERVVLDGKELKRHDDYYLDVDFGILTFYKEDMIREDSKVEVYYERAPFFGGGGETVAGASGNLQLAPNFNLGSSLFYQGNPGGGGKIPDLRSAPAEKSIMEFDAQLTDLKIPLIPGKMKIAGEVARSDFNPNTAGKAIVESMEGIKQVDSAGLYKESWLPAANPTGMPPTTLPTNIPYWGKENERGEITTAGILNNEDIYLRDINPIYQTGQYRTDEKRQVLVLNYDLVPSTFISIAQNLSSLGMDFSRKKMLETWIYGDGSGAELLIHYGTINENSDADNSALDTEDINNDGRVNVDEDLGILFTNPDGTTVSIGQQNGRLDTEDLDTDGRLRTSDDFTGGVFSVFYDTTQVRVDKINWTGWKMLTLPIEITDRNNWVAIKNLRITLRGGSQRGKIKLGYLALVGNKWEDGIVTGDNKSIFTVSAVNNEDNMEYVDKSLFDTAAYRELYRDELEQSGIRWRREQTLSLQYSLIGISTGTTRIKFPSPGYDFSKYTQLKFYLYPYRSTGKEIFFLQLKNTAGNYYEYQCPINWTNGWEAKIVQLPLEDQGIPSKDLRKFGTADLRYISELQVGIYTLGVDSFTRTDGELWVNELYLDGVRRAEGVAWLAEGDWIVPGWFSTGLRYLEQEPEFQTLTSVTKYQRKKERGLSLGINRFSFLPFDVSSTWNTIKNERVGENELISSLDEGTVEDVSLTGNISIIIPRLPPLSLRYKKSAQHRLDIKRVDERETYNYNLNIVNPLKNVDLFPTKYITFRPFPQNFNLSYTIDNAWLRQNPTTNKLFISEDDFAGRLYPGELNEKAADYWWLKSFDYTRSFGLSTVFSFWQGFNLDGGYSLSRVSAEEYAAPGSTETVYFGVYDKSINQKVNLNTSQFRLFPWFAPSARFESTNQQNINTMTKSDKSVNRNTTIELGNITIPIEQLSGSLSILKTLRPNFRYNYTASDTYEKIETTAAVTDRFWIARDAFLLHNQGQRKRFALSRELSGAFNAWKPFADWQIPFLRFPKLINNYFKPFETFAITSSYLNKIDETEEVGTETKTSYIRWPDLTVNIENIDKLFFLDRIFTGFTINSNGVRSLRETERTQRVIDESLRLIWSFRFLNKRTVRFEITSTTNETEKYNRDNNRFSKESKGNKLGFTLNVPFDIGKLQFNPNYTYNSDRTFRIVEDKEDELNYAILHKFGIGTSLNTSFPQGIKLPFIQKTITLPNQLMVSGNLNFERNDTKDKKLNRLNFVGDGTYTVSNNLQAKFGLTAGLLVDEKLPKENNFTVGGNIGINITF